jgi:hypothetical protein
LIDLTKGSLKWKVFLNSFWKKKLLIERIWSTVTVCSLVCQNSRLLKSMFASISKISQKWQKVSWTNKFQLQNTLYGSFTLAQYRGRFCIKPAGLVMEKNSFLNKTC